MSATWDRAPRPQAPCVLESAGHRGTVVLALVLLALMIALGIAL